MKNQPMHPIGGGRIGTGFRQNLTDYSGPF